MTTVILEQFAFWAFGAHRYEHACENHLCRRGGCRTGLPEDEMLQKIGRRSRASAILQMCLPS